MEAFTTTRPHPDSLIAKAKKPAQPCRTVCHNTRGAANELHTIVASQEFKELKRAIRTIENAERILAQLPFALSMLQRATRNS